MSFRSLKDDRDHKTENVKLHRKVGKRRSNSAPSININKSKDVNAKDRKGRTSLYYASKYGELEIVRHLLNNGADPDLSDNTSSNPIHESVDGGHLDVTELLIRKGCNLNCKNIFGQTPLMRATLFDDHETMKVLIKSGANIDEIDCTGKTALLIGLREGNDCVCRYLITSGCDVNVLDHLGKSALYFATHRKPASVSMCKKLFRYGYSAKCDSEWLTKDLHRKLLRNGLKSRLMHTLGLTKLNFDMDYLDDLHCDDYIDVERSRHV